MKDKKENSNFVEREWNEDRKLHKGHKGFQESSAIVYLLMGFPGGSEGKASACNAGDPGSIPWSGRSPGEGNGTPLHYSCLENPMDRGAWQATVHGIAKSRTLLSVHSLRPHGL